MRYFTIDEFDCPSQEGSGQYMDGSFLNRLDKARGIAGIPFKINSAYRTPEHNKKVGGKSTSSHLKGLAVDIHCTDSSSRFKIIDALRQAGFSRIGIAKTFIHVDFDIQKSQKVIWVY